jgi:hypothetical protein
MFVNQFRVENYSSFDDSGWIELDPKFNLFIGQNNSGKSALIKAFHYPLADNPHKNGLVFRGGALKRPKISYDVRITVGELFSRFRDFGDLPNFPCGDGGRAAQAQMQELFSEPENVIQMEFERQPGQDTVPRQGASIPSFRFEQNQVVYRYAPLASGGVSLEGRVSNPDNLAKLFTGPSSESFFYFDAQRLNLARSPLGAQQRLAPNASNLASVLAYLQGSRRPVFDAIEGHVVDILAGIDGITVTPRSDAFEILVWPDRDARYEELAFSLDESGTGVGQLLAIITAVATSEESVILIDEINSFLHPSAVKRLLALLRSEYGRHQYIISSHSSDAIASSNAERLYIVAKQGFRSYVAPVSLEDAAQAREVAGALGFSMMDVFGHDRLIWVEGPTEELCFQHLARRLDIVSEPGLGFASVSSTDGFSKSGESRSAADIYDRAAKTLAPLLRGMAFGLDRERLSDEAVAKLQKSKRKLRFLPRRCLECYLLDPEAISHVLSELDNRHHTPDAVRQAFEVGSLNEYGASSQWNGDIGNLDWLKRVDGARLLSRTFNVLTETRVEYRKTRDGISILNRILDENGEQLQELIAFVKSLIAIAQRDSAP